MRLAYKVWAGIAAGVFCLVAITDLSNGSSSSPTPVASTPALTPTVTATPGYGSSASGSPSETVAGPAVVSGVVSPANFTLSDGRGIHVPMMNAILPWQGQYTDACEQQADLALATQMLTGKTVVLSTARTQDTDAAVPATYTQADVSVGGSDYATAFEAQAYQSREAACPTPTYTPDPTTSPPSSSSADSDSDGGGSVYVPHHNLPDGALTGGFCRHHRWC